MSRNNRPPQSPTSILPSAQQASKTQCSQGLPRFKAFNSPRQVLRYTLRKYQSIEFSNIELERYHTALDRTFYHTQPTPRGTCISDFYPSPIVHPSA
ncbi:hypothetical protein L211DRAFT_834968 [Terfezia boudieri ATCC MYA-4762]|uniref:Uncharacterized protein n=1 Tax=Terfezia boudieri ATCC MYA-4762 TaxID=1051890 RepID=A0A3N4MDB2_9PEZI|nr:hypothetical protein L211DRAFT_834968 [Terfezia boudieri ATCC MYA-4762]